MTTQRISGTLAAAVTPLRDDGTRLDEDAFAPLLEFYAAAGLDGLLVLGTTGEGILLGGIIIATVALLHTIVAGSAAFGTDGRVRRSAASSPAGPGEAGGVRPR